MELQEALEIVRKLADGLHPDTGASLPADCLFQHPQSVRALQQAVEALERQHHRQVARASLPPNAGKPWTNEEDANLFAELSRGASLPEIAAAHNRRLGSIAARVMRLRQKTIEQKRKTA